MCAESNKAPLSWNAIKIWLIKWEVAFNPGIWAKVKMIDSKLLSSLIEWVLGLAYLNVPKSKPHNLNVNNGAGEGKDCKLDNNCFKRSTEVSCEWMNNKIVG